MSYSLLLVSPFLLLKLVSTLLKSLVFLQFLLYHSLLKGCFDACFGSKPFLAFDSIDLSFELFVHLFLIDFVYIWSKLVAIVCLFLLILL